MKNKEIVLITGVAGFIGSKIAKKFLEEKYFVYGVDDLSSGKKKNIPSGVKFIKIDLSKKKNIKLLPKKCNQIFHLAGQSSGEISFENPEKDLEKNVISTLNLIKYGISVKAKKIIYASSMSVYGNHNEKKLRENMICKPLSCYGNGKLASENYLKIFKKKIPYLILRMFNVYGPGQDMKNLKQGMVSIYLEQAIKNKKIIVKGSLNRVRDFIFIDDVVNIWFNLFKSNLKNQIFNLGTGKPQKVKNLLTLIKQLLPFTKLRLKAGTPGDQFFVCSNNTKIKKELKIEKFVDLKKGLGIFVNYLKSNN